MKSSVELNPRDELTEKINIRLSKNDLALLAKISRMRGQSSSDFIRLAMRRELARLGFLGEEEKQALGVSDEK